MSEPRYTPTPGGIYHERKKKKPVHRKAGKRQTEKAAEKPVKKSMPAKIFSVIWKSMLVGIIYIVSVVFFGGLVLGIGANLPELKRDLEIYLLELFVSGGAIAALLGPIHASTNISLNKRFLSISLIVFLTSTALLIEETFFSSGTISHDMLPGLIIQHLLVSVMTGYMVAILFGEREFQPSQPDETKRPVIEWTWRIGVSIAAYSLLTYGIQQLHTAIALQPSFQAQTGMIPGARGFSFVTPIHGSLMILSILPLLLFMRTTTLKKAITGGSVLFVIGGIIPVLTKIAVFPMLLLALTVAEIFLQDFLSGAIGGLFLGKKELEPKREPRLHP